MKFRIVTPCYNRAKFITETIESVISQQGDFAIDYVIVDGDSSDGTPDLLRGYKEKIEKWLIPIGCGNVTFSYICEKDQGMYEAINKGFLNSDADIYAWINSDDVYLPGAFQKMVDVFSKNPHIQWLKGITSYINEQSEVTEKGACYRYRQDWIKKGFYGRELVFIQQDSVFWRKSLWDRAGPTNASLRLAGDFALWIAFSQFEPLYSLDEEVSCFRKVEGQLSARLDLYRAEMARIVPQRPDWLSWVALKLYRRMPGLFLMKTPGIIQTEEHEKREDRI